MTSTLLRTVVLCSAAIVVFQSPAIAQIDQTNTISGVVTTGDGSPVVGVQVSIVGTNLGTITNAEGRFSIRNVPPGEHELQVQSLNFAPQRRRLIVMAGSASHLSIVLSNKPDQPKLGVVSTPESSLRVFVNGVRKGTTPDELILNPGMQRIRFVKPGSNLNVCELEINLELGDRQCIKCTTTTGTAGGC